MVVCICNALNERDINEALRKCKSPNEVHSTCDCQVQCGCCLELIKQMAETEGYSNG